MRRLICLCLLLCVPLYGFAMQWGPLLVGTGTTLAHEVAHDQRLQHHLDADGSVHFDNSDASAQHLADHPTSPHPAYPVVPGIAVPPDQLLGMAVPHVPAWLPDPFQDCLQRPPSPFPG